MAQANINFEEESNLRISQNVYIQHKNSFLNWFNNAI